MDAAKLTAYRNLHLQWAILERAPPLRKDCSGQWGKFVVVQVWNASEYAAQKTLDPRWLGGLGQRFHVWSFWDEKYLGRADASFRTPLLQPRSSVLLRLTDQAANDDTPVLIGSNLHIAIGSAELKDVAVRVRSMQISLTDAGAREGTLYVFGRARLTLEAASGLVISSLQRRGENLSAIMIHSRLRGRDQIISLRWHEGLPL